MQDLFLEHHQLSPEEQRKRIRAICEAEAKIKASTTRKRYFDAKKRLLNLVLFGDVGTGISNNGGKRFLDGLVFNSSAGICMDENDMLADSYGQNRKFRIGIPRHFFN